MGNAQPLLVPEQDLAVTATEQEREPVEVATQLVRPKPGPPSVDTHQPDGHRGLGAVFAILTGRVDDGRRTRTPCCSR